MEAERRQKGAAAVRGPELGSVALAARVPPLAAGWRPSQCHNMDILHTSAFAILLRSLTSTQTTASSTGKHPQPAVCCTHNKLKFEAAIEFANPALRAP